MGYIDGPRGQDGPNGQDGVSGIPSNTREIYNREYNGFESFYDYFRDVHEAVDPDFNDKVRGIPCEFKGTFTVKITYTEPTK